MSKFQKYATHMEFDFPKKTGSGIAKLIPNVSQDLLDLLSKLLTYNPDERISASLALRHPWFKEMRDSDKIAA